ncbi:MAG: single-stranded-DNA-specific exonuclease RecJ [Oscillospiraceae bacterium]|nr:single-stranded-DNA-specific exonuclease RecJ [Oscillospiraceae bacterium]
MRSDKWDVAGFDREKAIELVDSGLSPLVAVLLASRLQSKSISPDELGALAYGKSPSIYDPFLMADMDKAVRRIKKAIADKERIAIYGDYDVDGMTSSALLATWLRTQGAEYEIYIPKRFGEGYSLNTGALDAIRSRGADLVITVDCGIIDTNEAAYAMSIGLDLIITDHHECRGELPCAYAVINPKRPDCAYPFKSLAGVGIVFKLICALEGDYLSDEIFRQFAQLAAIGTVADVMPVVGENRELIRRGLGAINTDPSPGVRRLIGDDGTDYNAVTAKTISYSIAPKLNAAGRMGDPLLSVDLLLCTDNEKAGQLVSELNLLNTQRRELEHRLFSEILTLLPPDGPKEPIILSNETGEPWHQGVTGIVSSKIADRFKLPSIIISVDKDGIGRGSCRSDDSFNMHSALLSCQDILITFGGHDKAAGLDIAAENIEKLRRRVTDYYFSQKGDAKGSVLKIDFEVTKPSLLELSNVEALTSLEPFGHGNTYPCLCIKNAALSGLFPIGDGRHSRIKAVKSGQTLDCIFFSKAPGDIDASMGDSVDIAFEPHINEYRGRRSVQLQLVDIVRSSCRM